MENLSDADLSRQAIELGQTLQALKLTVTTAESCTGGWVGKTVTDNAGSSSYFLGGLITYHDVLKQSLLSVPAPMLAQHGAVSEPVVRQMAQGARHTTGADMSVAVSGVAGPGGGSADKPVGTVWLAWATDDVLASVRRQFDGDRDQIRRQTVALALHGLQCLADEKPIT